MVDLTNAQQVSFTFVVKDGFGNAVPLDGEPVVAISDPTVVSVRDFASADGKTWTGTAVAGVPSPTTARITVTADDDMTPTGVDPQIGTLDVNVTLDPRFQSRIVSMTAGAPVDQPGLTPTP
jgi:hypothetical protein